MKRCVTPVEMEGDLDPEYPLQWIMMAHSAAPQEASKKKLKQVGAAALLGYCC
jgi:hypothetical protein